MKVHVQVHLDIDVEGTGAIGRLMEVSTSDALVVGLNAAGIKCTRDSRGWRSVQTIDGTVSKRRKGGAR